MCGLDGYMEMKGTGLEEDDYVLCSLDGYPEKKGTSGGGRLRVERVDGYMEMKGTGLEGGET